MEVEMRKEAEKYAIVKYKAESTELFTKNQTYKAYTEEEIAEVISNDQY